MGHVAKRLRPQKAKDALVNAWGIANDKPSQIDADLEPEQLERAVQRLFPNAQIIATPHARARYRISQDDFRPVYDRLQTADTGFARAWRLTAELGWDWLNESLDSAYEAVESGEPTEQAWEPLELDREEPELKQVIAQIEEVKNLVERDNGYAASEPAERYEVLAGLRSAVDVLRNAPLATATALRVYIAWPLERLLSRFNAETFIGGAAKLAKDIFVAWLKKRGAEQIDDWFS